MYLWAFLLEPPSPPWPLCNISQQCNVNVFRKVPGDVYMLKAVGPGKVTGAKCKPGVPHSQSNTLCNSGHGHCVKGCLTSCPSVQISQLLAGWWVWPGYWRSLLMERLACQWQALKAGKIQFLALICFSAIGVWSPGCRVWGYWDMWDKGCCFLSLYCFLWKHSPWVEP